jgi:hypothetical protein
VSLNVPSRPTVVALDEGEWEVKDSDDPVTTVLKVIRGICVCLCIQYIV